MVVYFAGGITGNLSSLFKAIVKARDKRSNESIMNVYLAEPLSRQEIKEAMKVL